MSFVILHPCFPMIFFPSNMSMCKFWQKHNNALKTHELNSPQTDTFKGNPTVFYSGCFCVQQILPTTWVLKEFSLSPPLPSDPDTLNFFILFISRDLSTSDSGDKNRTLDFLHFNRRTLVSSSAMRAFKDTSLIAGTL